MTDAAPPVADNKTYTQAPADDAVDARDAGGARSPRFVAGVLLLVLIGM